MVIFFWMNSSSIANFQLHPLLLRKSECPTPLSSGEGVRVFVQKINTGVRLKNREEA